MKRRLSIFPFLTLLVILIVSGCATLPTGPSVSVMPGTGKTFEQFQADDAVCRQWAAQQIGQSTQQTINQNTVAGAAAGTVIGAGLGAAIGAASGNAGIGAAIGAGSGLLVGTASGASAGQAYGWETQRRYNIAYTQCMYAKGNQVPGVVARARRYRTMPPPPPPPYLQSEQQPIYPAPPPAARVIDRLTIHVNFDFDKSTIRKADDAELRKAIVFVGQYPGTKVELEGYTDSKGTEQYNQRLSEKRADAVMQYLINEGAVDKARISARGYGASRPIAPNKTKDGKDNPKGRAENRRVEVLIISE